MQGNARPLVLLVEDQAVIAMSEKAILEKHGFTVILALSGEEAVAIFDSTPGIDVVLMDIDLGAGMDGTEAAAAILGRRDVPVVFLSSHSDPATVERTERITCYGYVMKSSGEHVLTTSIKMACRLFAARAIQRESEEALRLNEERLRHIVEAAHDLVWETDAAGVTTYVSPNIESLLGYRPEEAVGRTGYDLMAPEDAARARAEFAPYVRQRLPFRGIRNVHLHKNGTRVLMESNGVPYFDREGAFLGFRGTDRNVPPAANTESPRT